MTRPTRSHARLARPHLFSLPRLGPARAGADRARADQHGAAGQQHRHAAVPAGDRPAELPDRRRGRRPRAQATQLRPGRSTTSSARTPIFTQTSNGSSETHLVANQLTSEIDAAIGLFGRYQVGIGIPFTFFLDGDEVNAMGAPANLHLRRDRHRRHPARRARPTSPPWAATTSTTSGSPAGLTLPTGHTGGRAYLGDKTVTGRIEAIGTIDFGPVRAARQPGDPDPRDLQQLRHRPRARSCSTAPPPTTRSTRRPTSSWRSPAAAASTSSSQFYNDVNPFEVDLAGRRAINGMWSVTGGRRARDRQRHRRAGPAPLRDGRLQPRLPRPRPRRHLRHRRQVPRPAGGSRRLPGRGRLPRSRQRRRRHPRRQGQVPQRGRGHRRLPGRRRLPRPRQRQRRHPRPQRRLPERARGPQGEEARTTAARRPPRTATATASPTTSTSAPTSPRTRTASRTPTAAPIPTTTATASPTTSTSARTRPRTPTASRTRTAAPIPTTTRTASPTRSTSARCSPRP